MPTCAVLGCLKRSCIQNLSKGGISYHRFPAQPTVKEKWIDATGRKDWFPSKNSVICSNHFDENDLFVKNVRRFLSDEAVPVKDIWNRDPVTCQEYHEIKPFEAKIMASDTKKQKIKQHVNINIMKRKLSTDDLQSWIPETPTVTPRRRLHEKIKHQENMINRQRLKIRRLQQQNLRYKLRLRKQNKQTENLLEAIRQRNMLGKEELSALKNANIQVK